MDLDLERFWAVVRPKRRSSRPKLAKKPKPKSIQIYVEAVESAHGSRCTNTIRATLEKVADGYRGEVRFEVLNSEVNITGLRWYLRPGGPVSFQEFSPRHLGPGDLLVLDFHILKDGAFMTKLRSLGLNLLVY